MTNSDNLALPFILPSQAQKHVTHNEALLALDAIVQLSVVSRTVSEGPDAAAAGARYIVPQDASGTFTDRTGAIAAYQDGVFQFYTPQTGWLAFILDENIYSFFDGADWLDLISSNDFAEYLTLGVNASADLTNRFTLSSEASLFNNAGNGHQLKINKAQATDTASLLFQTGYSGRAEFGLAGDDQFRIKTSADGANFNTALVADATTGNIAIGDINPSAVLTVADQAKIENASSSAALEMSVTASETDISSTAQNGSLLISQLGDGAIIFSVNNEEILRLEDGLITTQMPVQLDTHSILSLPDATVAGRMIYVTDSTLGSCIAFSDGSNWRRSEDRSIIT
ncbi:MAG: DUF2793 domain-containing protein [Lentilitoribacter sp.]